MIRKYAVLLILGVAFGCESEFKSSNRSFSIDLWDYDQSISRSLHYHLDNDSILVELNGGIEGEKTKVLFSRNIGKLEIDRIFKVLDSMDLVNLKRKYLDPLIEDGNQKSIVINFMGSESEIEVSNVDVPELMPLIRLINSGLIEKYRIKNFR